MKPKDKVVAVQNSTKLFVKAFNDFYQSDQSREPFSHNTSMSGPMSFLLASYVKYNSTKQYSKTKNWGSHSDDLAGMCEIKLN